MWCLVLHLEGDKEREGRCSGEKGREGGGGLSKEARERERKGQTGRETESVKMHVLIIKRER